MVDTSAIYALLDKSDDMHDKAKTCLYQLAKNKNSIVITNFIVAECHALLAGRLNPEIARTWLKQLYWPVERIAEEDEIKALNIILSYQDKTFSYTDATTFAVMERLGINNIFAFDKHFAQYGFILYSDTTYPKYG